VVEVRDKLFMIDCGEGTQMQLRRSHIRFTKIGHVFISHLHGDHCFGLIGMISTFGMLGRTAKLHIYATAELGPMLQSQLDMFCDRIGYEVVFHPIDTRKHEVIYEDRSLSVTTIPLEHRVPCCGFLFREKPTLPHIRKEMIDFYHIPTSQIANIKAGADWQADDGTIIANQRLVYPAEPPRSYAYCSDTRYIGNLHQRIMGVSTLYHESTYANDNLQLATKYFHSTAQQAAQVALDAQARQLLLGHYSSRYENEEILLQEARTVFENTLLTEENMVIDV
jgi:ribonuclease Z